MEIINFTDSLMRILLAAFILPILFLGCSSVEKTTEQETEEQAIAEEVDTSVPNWFNPLKTSASDSLSVHGFALASDVDSSEAVTLAEKTALNNLRYEIDYIAEKARVRLIEDDNLTAYSDASFIIRLRNLIRDLPLQEADLDIEAHSFDSNIYNVYAKASLPKNTLWELVSGRLNDSDFVRAIETVPSE